MPGVRTWGKNSKVQGQVRAHSRTRPHQGSSQLSIYEGTCVHLPTLFPSQMHWRKLKQVCLHWQQTPRLVRKWQQSVPRKNGVVARQEDCRFPIFIQDTGALSASSIYVPALIWPSSTSWKTLQDALSKSKISTKPTYQIINFKDILKIYLTLHNISFNKHWLPFPERARKQEGMVGTS